MTVSERIISETASIEGVDPTDLPPLYNSVDPDALEQMVESLDETCTIKFDYSGYSVTVTGDGSVSVEQPTEY